MEYDLEIIEYLEEQSQAIMDAYDSNNHDLAYSLLSQLLGSMNVLLRCKLFNSETEFQKADDIYMQLTQYLIDLNIAAYNMRVTID